MLKRIAEAVMGGAMATPWIHLRGRSLILGYHNVVVSPAEAGGDASLHVRLDRFRSHLDALLRTHRVVPLDELLERPEGGALRVALTFDDACRGALRHAVPELARRGLPATLFVVPGMLDQPFWWDRIGGPAPAVSAFRDHVLGTLQGDGEEAVAAAAERGLEVMAAPSAAHAANEAELRHALEHTCITVGSHSWNHRNLAALPDEALEVEVRRPLEWLEDRFEPGQLSRWIAYPYGLYDPRVERAVKAAGYRGGLRIEGGCLPRVLPRDAISVPRVNVPAGLTARGLRLRAVGLRKG